MDHPPGNYGFNCSGKVVWQGPGAQPKRAAEVRQEESNRFEVAARLIDERENGVSEKDPQAWMREAAVTLSRFLEHKPRECNNQECGWKGFTDRMLGSIGPLCPRCGETTE